MANILVEKKYLDKIVSIISDLYPKAVIWAYGSRVDGTAHAGSDLDLAIKSYGQKDTDYMELKETLQNSDVPFLVDIFEFDRLPDSFQKEIKRNYVVLFDGQKGRN